MIFWPDRFYSSFQNLFLRNYHEVLLRLPHNLYKKEYTCASRKILKLFAIFICIVNIFSSHLFVLLLKIWVFLLVKTNFLLHFFNSALQKSYFILQLQVLIFKLNTVIILTVATESRFLGITLEVNLSFYKFFFISLNFRF